MSYTPDPCLTCGGDLNETRVYDEHRYAGCPGTRVDDVTDDDGRPCVYVDTDHNPDDVRTYYEVPQAIVERIRPLDDERTFAQALADLLEHP